MYLCVCRCLYVYTNEIALFLCRTDKTERRWRKTTVFSLFLPHSLFYSLSGSESIVRSVGVATVTEKRKTLSARAYWDKLWPICRTPSPSCFIYLLYKQ